MNNRVKTNELKNSNPLLCDPEQGVCGIPDSVSGSANVRANTGKKVKVIYFTDPICSSCWGIEPQLRKLKLEYGDSIEVEYCMGGLLPDWSYNSGGISKPSDVAHHWDEVSVYYDMPIDGDVWLEDPLHSSYPPSIAFNAAKMQDKAKAVLFLREIREMVFIGKKNITKWDHIQHAAGSAGLDVDQLKNDFDGQAIQLFESDLKFARESGVRGFPTMFFVDSAGNKETVYGSKPYALYETAVLKLDPHASKAGYDRSWEALFSEYHSLTAREFAELSGIPRKECDEILDGLTGKGILEKRATRNGSIWKSKQG